MGNTISMLFESKQRVECDSKTYIESDWSYLDRSGRIESQRIRDFLDRWIAEYPESARAELISRFRCGDNKSFRSAAFEVVIFSLLRSLGCEVSIHPELPNGTGKSPDFLAVTSTGQSVYLEAVLVSEYSAAEASARKRTEVLLNEIEKIDSPNFFIGVELRSHPNRPPSGKRLRAELEHWVASLDPDTITNNLSENSLVDFPRMQWQHDGWSIDFKAIPIKPDRRGKGQRVVGLISEGARWANDWELLRDAVKSKGNRYGELSHPLLIAVNLQGTTLDRTDEVEALFGQEEYSFSAEDFTAPPSITRKPNGAWIGPEGEQYTRISGVWFFNGLHAWNLGSRKSTVYFNPFASKPLPALFQKLCHAKPNEEHVMEWFEGQELGDVLGLPPKWPECNF